MRVLIANTKGGVGKSTTAMQVMVPYIYQKINDKANLIEFDDENQDSVSFQNSNVVNAKQERVSSNDLDSALIDNLVNCENIVIDVGGNKTTTIIFEKLSETGMGNLIDVALIPLGDGEQDAINAINTYNKIKELNDSIKVIFVLSRCDNNMDTELQFIDFFGDTKGRIDGRDGYINKVNDNDKNIIKIYNSDVIKYSRLFGITAFELAQFDIKELQQKLMQYTQEKQNNKVKKVAYRLTIVNKAKKYINSVLNECFKTLDKVIA